jgi:hypothetical protein
MAESQMFDDTALDPRKMVDTVIPQFFINSVIDKEKTREAGREIYKDVAFVRISTPGNKNEEVIARAKESHKKRWPQYWKAFQEGTEAIADGFPLDHWVLASPAERAALKSIKCMTVEQLAAMPEGNFPKLMPNLPALQIKARNFLEKSTDGAHIARIEKKTELQDQRIKDLEDSNEDLKGQCDALLAQLKPQDVHITNPKTPQGGKTLK